MSSPGWSGAFAAEPGVGCRWAATLKGSNKEHLAGELPALVNPFRGWLRIALSPWVSPCSTHGYSSSSPPGTAKMSKLQSAPLGRVN